MTDETKNEMSLSDQMKLSQEAHRLRTLEAKRLKVKLASSIQYQKKKAELIKKKEMDKLKTKL